VQYEAVVMLTPMWRSNGRAGEIWMVSLFSGLSRPRNDNCIELSRTGAEVPIGPYFTDDHVLANRLFASDSGDW